MSSMDQHGPGAGPNSAVLQAFEPYIDALADKLAERLERRRGRMINQHESELGPRRHRDAVKRRLDNGEGGAGRAGRNYLLTVEAVREELSRKGGRGKGDASPASPANDRPPSGGNGAKSRARELADFERDVMRDLRAVQDR